jgi:hypothetical protein
MAPLPPNNTNSAAATQAPTHPTHATIISTKPALDQSPPPQLPDPPIDSPPKRPTPSHHSSNQQPGRDHPRLSHNRQKRKAVERAGPALRDKRQRDAVDYNTDVSGIQPRMPADSEYNCGYCFRAFDQSCSGKGGPRCTCPYCTSTYCDWCERCFHQQCAQAEHFKMDRRNRKLQCFACASCGVCQQPLNPRVTQDFVLKTARWVHRSCLN